MYWTPKLFLKVYVISVRKINNIKINTGEEKYEWK